MLFNFSQVLGGPNPNSIPHLLIFPKWVVIFHSLYGKMELDYLKYNTRQKTYFLFLMVQNLCMLIRMNVRYSSPSTGEGGGLVPVFTELTRNLFETGKQNFSALLL
jgi:hypothetical protein